MSNAFDLMVAPNGARLTQVDHPAVPITIAEIAQTAVDCTKAGATGVHTHVRDRNGRHSLNAGLYAQVVRKITTKSSINIQFSTEAAGIFDVDAQRQCLGAAPTHDASVALREIARDPAGLGDTYRLAATNGVDVQHIVYDPDDLAALLAHFDAGDIDPGSKRVLFVLGRYAVDQMSSPHDLDPFLKTMASEKLDWMVCAFGQNEQACLLAALNAGGNARIGFENNRRAPNGAVFPDNAASVAAFVEAADKAGFQPKNPTQ